ncbi:MAG: TrpR family protein YerC/YecD [Microgenomates group bacterium GW2011_GWA2_44_7]|nr:MAG: TrpR family protein YerC/YecD [Microgenomates group bacterium GW2011_GWA2_44_7]KKT78146.1 MAG: TrpR family protein YerC/YecD [Microgenomates group bacterium GW2011_GWB1_44_8]
MRVSKKKLNPNLEKEITRLFFQTIADLKTPQFIKAFLSDLLSEAETTAVVKRLAIIYWLSNKRSYENIRENLKVSSATIAAIEKQTKDSAGIQLALKYIKADEWADEWAKRIKIALGQEKNVL